MVNSPDDYEKWERLCGKGRILAAFPGAGGGFEGEILDAALTPRIIQATTFAEINGKKSVRQKKLAEIFKDSNIPYQVVKDMHIWQICHLAMVVPIADAFYESEDAENAGKDLVLMRKTAKRNKRNYYVVVTNGIKLSPKKMNSEKQYDIVEKSIRGTKMAEQTQILNIINENYPISFDRIEFVRDSGCVAYTVYSSECKYFLRITKPMFFETASKSLDIHLFLQKQSFAVPRVIFTKGGSPYVQVNDEEGDCFYVLYEFLEGKEVDPEQDAEDIGAFIGKMHSVMKGYPGELIKNDKHYYLDRYIDIMRSKQYEKIDEFIAYGEALWKKVKDLPYGYCHGDMYRGNILKDSDGNLYILDFDTSCEGFPMYDLALICNITDYFELEDDGYLKSKKVYERLLPEYLKYSSLTKAEIEAFYDLIALYHFALQATIIEIFGLDCVDNEFLDRQLEWLYKWREQCGKHRDD